MWSTSQPWIIGAVPILSQRRTLITSDNMEKEQLVEFKLFQDEALARLRAGVSRKGYLGKFRALVLPSFEDCHAYEILFSPRSTDVPGVAARTVWRRSIDVEKFRNPVARLKHGLGPLEPTIEEVQAGIPREPITKLLSKAGAATIPACIVDHGFGLDGTSYELVLGSDFVETRFKWWCDAPTGWEPVSTIFGEIKALVDSAIVAGS
jgi:hypothetical protein